MVQTDCFITKLESHLHQHLQSLHIHQPQYFYTCFNNINVSTLYLPSLVFLSTICSVLHLGQRRRGSVCLSSSLPRTIMIKKSLKVWKVCRQTLRRYAEGVDSTRNLVIHSVRFLTTLEPLQMKVNLYIKSHFLTSQIDQHQDKKLVFRINSVLSIMPQLTNAGIQLSCA